jgi:hypothetical protein
MVRYALMARPWAKSSSKSDDAGPDPSYGAREQDGVTLAQLGRMVKLL